MALISKTGASLLGLQLNGVQVIDHEAASELSEIFFGSLLAPWPNRLDGGRFKHLGKTFVAGELDGDGNANHGLVSNASFEAMRAEDTEVVLAYQFGDDSGFPFALRLQVYYQLLDDGLRVEAEVSNQGSNPAPFAIGFHPYFLAPEPFELSGAFTEVVETDSRMLPVRNNEIAGLSFTGGELDSCFLGSDRVALKTANFELEVINERGLDRFMFYRPGSDLGKSMIAVEPMSAPANAFATEIDKHLLAPDETRNYSYLIRRR